MSYKRFNRHECFTSEMMEMTRTSIREIEDLALAQKESMFNSATNSLYGLYDGYLYDNLLEEVLKFNPEQSTINKVKGLIKATEMYIQLMGEGVTQV